MAYTYPPLNTNQYYDYSYVREETSSRQEQMLKFLKSVGFCNIKNIEIRKFTSQRVDSYKSLHEDVYDTVVQKSQGIQLEITEEELERFYRGLLDRNYRYNMVFDEHAQLSSKDKKERRIRDSNTVAKKAYEHYQTMLALAGDPQDDSKGK